MRRKNWKGQTHPVARWIAKLVEETGEVGQELARHTLPSVKDYERAITELEHVEFIAKCFREDLERRLA